jgi:pilus assembly protein Flp/PilA
MRLAGRFLNDERGATSIEYGLICSLIFLAIVSAVRGFASNTSLMYGKIASNMP